jgi:CRISPR-associated protein Cas5t
VKLLRIEGKGLTTSFRYPFFMMGRHPTFPMPPPATIYGHICSALGEWVAPEGLEFGYWFSASGRGIDLEHIHLLRAATGTFEMNGAKYPKRAETADQPVPFRRDLLFQPRLILYLNRPDWLEAFRSPRYPVVLGRSQDLFTYADVRVIDAGESPAYVENTIVQFGFETSGRGASVVMPRFIDYERGREVEFEPYVVVTRRMFPESAMLVDPESPDVKDELGILRKRAIVLHSFRASADGPA